MEIITTTATIFLAVMGACCSPEGVCATVCSTEPIGITWELRYIQTGPPVYGEDIARGALPLNSDCRTLAHIPQRPGNYEFVFWERGSNENEIPIVRSDVCVVPFLPDFLPTTGRKDFWFRCFILTCIIGAFLLLSGVTMRMQEIVRRKKLEKPMVT